MGYYRFSPPVSPAMVPLYALIFLLVGGATLAYLVMYEMTSNRFTRDLKKEVVLAGITAVTLGYGLLFSALAVGLYV